MYRLLSGLHAHLTRKEEFNVIILGLDHAGKTTLLEKTKTIFTPSQPGLNPSQITPTIGQNIGRITLSSTYLKFWDLGGSREIRSIWEKYYNEADAICWVIDSQDRFRNGWKGDQSGPAVGIGGDAKGKGKAKADARLGGAESGAPSGSRGEGWLELEKVLRHPSIAHSKIPVLVIANKQDRRPGPTGKQAEGSSRGTSDGQGTDAGTDVGLEEQGLEPMSVDEIKEMFNRLVVESDRSEKARSLGLSEAHVIGVSALSGHGIRDAINWLFYRVASKGQSRKSQQQAQTRIKHPPEPSRSTLAPPNGNTAPIRLADLGRAQSHPPTCSPSRSNGP